MTTFEFYRFRFHFRAIDSVQFPEGKSGNAVRGAFGLILHQTVAPAVYKRFFEPRSEPDGRTPSGLGDWPRPFVFRAASLDGARIPEGGAFSFDVHVFDLGAPAVEIFRAAFSALAGEGIGVGRGRASLEYVEQLDLEDRAIVLSGSSGAPCVATLDPQDQPIRMVRVRFLTPTELKTGGALAGQPDFPALFGRLRDRLSTLRALYGAGPLDVDFRGMGEKATTIELARCELSWERVERRSGRTGQVHSIGGFTGEAEYHGDLREFLPWLRAARWVGVGRQTVWGKGDLRVIEAKR